MRKIIFLCIISIQFSFSQKLHHQVVASQGGIYNISNGFRILQSVGQVNAMIGNYKIANLVIGQGYIQSFALGSNSLPIQNPISMILYPNPVIDKITFTFSSNIGEKAQLYLFDSRGRLIYSHLAELYQNSSKYDLSNIAEGVYFAKIETSNHIFSTKLIKTQ